MEPIRFDYEKLNRDDRRIYDLMTENEKETFERLWISIETQKLKLFQRKNAAKERDRREKTVLAERQRKERTHRLIERGAMLETFLEEPECLSNEQVMEILTGLFKANRTQIEETKIF